MKIKEKSVIGNSWILPDRTLTEEEFLDGIKKAEQAEFMSVQESMQKFEAWMKSREKK